MHKEYILLNGFRKAKKGFTAGFHVPLSYVLFQSITELTRNLPGYVHLLVALNVQCILFLV